MNIYDLIISDKQTVSLSEWNVRMEWAHSLTALREAMFGNCTESNLVNLYSRIIPLIGGSITDYAGGVSL